jgi:hypothetical protein
MNRSSVTPPITTTRRINSQELVKPEEATNDEKMSISSKFTFHNYVLVVCESYFSSVIFVESVPLALMCPFICGVCCGVGKPPQDPDTLSVLAINIDDVTEVAGAEAYSKCGFDTSELKHM